MSPAAPLPRASYGIDAPGVMAGLIGAGLGIEAGAAALRMLLPGLPGAVPILASVAGLVPLALGTAMAVYAAVGKRRTRDRILRAVVWRGDETVLDIGTGRGFLAIGAARRLTTGRAIGIDLWRAGDLSGNGPKAAAANARAEGVADRVEIRSADARDLPLPDGSVDVVLSLLCLHNLPDADGRARACREIARVLKPGGNVVLGDYVPTAPYGAALAEAGLTVRRSKPAFGTAFSLMWILEATKPALGAGRPAG